MFGMVTRTSINGAIITVLTMNALVASIALAIQIGNPILLAMHMACGVRIKTLPNGVIIVVLLDTVRKHFVNVTIK